MENDKHRGNLGSRFAGFTAAPSEGLWDSIADSLDGKKKRRGFVWWWFGAGMAAIGLISAMVINWQASPSLVINNDAGEILRYDLIEKSQDGAKGRHEELISKFEKSRSIVLNGNQEKESDLKHALADGNNNDEPIEPFKINDIVLNSSEKTTENVKDAMVDESEKKNLIVVSEPTKETPKLDRITSEGIDRFAYMDGMPSLELKPIAVTEFLEPMIALTAPAVKNSKWEIGFGLSHWSRFPSTKADGVAAFGAADPVDPTDESLDYYYKPINIVRRSIGSKFHIGYRLGKRFRLIFGLFMEGTTYAQDKPSGSSLFYTPAGEGELGLDKYKVTSLGIPLGVEYDFIKHKRFSMGTGLNILSEIPIIETYKAGNSGASTQENGVVRDFIIGYDLGFNLNLNTSYALNERLRIQVNPGVRWYIKQSESYALFDLPKRKAWFGGSVNLIWRL